MSNTVLGRRRIHHSSYVNALDWKSVHVHDQPIVMERGWKVLQVDQSPAGSLPLLLKYETTPTSYTVWLSDMQRVWSECLDRKKVIQRAFDIDSCIDPSDGNDQFQQLMRQLERGLDHSEGSVLEVQSLDNDSVEVALTITLPKPLPLLKWFFDFTRCPSLAVTNNMLVPVLNQRLIDASAISALLQEVKEKDKIISKFVDSTQSDGIPISRYFPKTRFIPSGAKTLTRETLGKYVSGMVEFSEGKWRADVERQINRQWKPEEVAAELFPEAPQPSVEAVINDVAQLKKMLRAREEAPPNVTLGPDKARGKPRKEDDEDADFQRQSTPPARKQNRTTKLKKDAPSPSTKSEAWRTLQNSLQDDASTTDDSSGGEEPSHKLPQKRKVPSPATNGHGPDLDRSRSASSLVSPEPTVPSTQPPISSEGQHQDPNTDPIPNYKPPTRKGRIGKIGGRKQPLESSSTPSNSNPNPTPTNQTRNHKTENGNETSPSTIQNDSPRRSGSSAAPPPSSSPPPKPETAEERANRKREALKRELEAQAQAGPKRKKRKF